MTTIDRDDPILVAGGGGFIGGWLVRHLQEEGFTNLRAVDLKPFDEWHQVDRRTSTTGSQISGRSTSAARPFAGWRTSTTSRATWAAWASSRRTRPPA